MERRIKSKVAIKDIHFDEELYPRSKYSWQTGYDYSQSMRNGAKFPLITLALLNGKKILVDGKHRVEAYKFLKKESIEAEIYTGWNKDKIFEEAIRRNIAHGRFLSPYEKRCIALKLKEKRYNFKAISELIQVPLDKLDNFIGQRLTWATTGEPIIVKTEISHMAGKTIENTTSIQNLQEPMYMNNQLDLIEDLIKLIENNLLDLSNDKISERLKYLKTLI